MAIVRRSIQKRAKVKQWKAVVLLMLIGFCSLLLWGCEIKSESLKNRLVIPLGTDIKTFKSIDGKWTVPDKPDSDDWILLVSKL